MNDEETYNTLDPDQSDQDVETAPDSVDLYLKEIANIPLLTAAQEAELAQRVATGDSEAKKTMIISNLRLVVNIAKKYMGRGLQPVSYTHLTLPTKRIV